MVYFVTDPAPFRHHLAWIERFGELMILQETNDMSDPFASGDSGFTYLMQFMDGNRFDLGIYPLDKIGERTDASLFHTFGNIAGAAIPYWTTDAIRWVSFGLLLITAAFIVVTSPLFKDGS